MTTFDEEMMKRALREAADDFAISDTAMESILDEHAILALRTNRRGSARSSRRNGRTSIDTVGCRCVRWWCWPSRATLQFRRRREQESKLSLMLKRGYAEQCEDCRPRSVRRDDHGNWFLPLARMLRPTCRQRRRTFRKVQIVSNASTVDSSSRGGSRDNPFDRGGTHFQSTLTQLTDSPDRR